MVQIVAIVALVLGLAIVLAQPLIARARRRRRRADRNMRHQRIAREWGFAQSIFGPRPKRLTDKRVSADGADD